MLRELRIRNFAVVENLTVPFAPGFNVLTGETGAGKSILVDAILLLRGARAQTDVIRADAETATVEAVFEVSDGAVATLDEAGLPLEDGEVVIRRELSRSGRHRAFVNDAAVTVGLLERLGDALVQVHGQHEHQRLLEPTRQLDVLDRFADAEPLRERFAALFAKHAEARAELERRRGAARDRAQRQDLLRFQVSELDAARVRVGEDDELRTERRRLQHAERFAAGLQEVGSLLHDDAASATARLARAGRVLSDLGRLDPAFAAPAETLGAARREAAAKLGPRVQRELRQLGMDRAAFEVATIDLAAGDWGLRGAERVEFRFTANPDEPNRPLARIASGGELARTMLALQVVLSGDDDAPTMVFDEVDAGIGGRAASVVGDKLAAHGGSRQVLCVTHLAPIAALADQHVRVAKSVRGGRTRGTTAVIAGDERAAEIARMLGGDASGAAALDHARALLRARRARPARSRGV